MGGVAPPLSPCTGICRIDDAGERCLGCGRTLDQIAAWPTMDDAERARVIAALASAPPA